MSTDLGLRVLCIDDDRSIRESLTELLAAEGYRVEVAESAEEGLELLERRSYDLLVTDYSLPGATGAWLVRQAERRGLIHKGASLLITSHSKLEDVNGVEVIPKPLDVDDFLARVHAHLMPARAREVERAQELLRSTGMGSSEKASNTRIELVLYVSNASVASLKAIRNLERLLTDYDRSQIGVSICDLACDPFRADADRITFTPTLVKRQPEPRVWIVGDLSQSQVIAEMLQHCGVERART